MLYDYKERAKVRKNISLLHQYANQLFPFNGDQRLVFIFVAFQLHPGFNELSHFLSTTVQALQLVNEVHSQRNTNSNPTSNLANYLQNGPVHLIDEDVLEVEIFSIRGTFAYKKLIHRQIQRFLLAKKLAVCVLSGGEFDVLGNVGAEKRALSVLYYQALPNICSVLQTDFGYNPPNLNKKILVDAEHALAAKCVLGESG